MENVNRVNGDGSLYKAVELGTEEEVKRLLQRGDIDVDKAGAYGSTPLHIAAHAGNTGIVEALLLKGAKPNVACDSGRTPLHKAISAFYISRNNNYQRVVQLLLDYGADPYKANNAEETPLQLAKAYRLDNIVKLLNVNETDKFGQTALCQAVELGTEEEVKRLLQRGDIDVDKAGAYGSTPLHIAAHTGNRGIVEALLLKGAKPNVACGTGRTPLHKAISALNTAPNNNYQRVVQLLLDYGADPYKANDAGETPLQLAKEHGFGSIEELLLGVEGASVRQVDPEAVDPEAVGPEAVDPARHSLFNPEQQGPASVATTNGFQTGA